MVKYSFYSDPQEIRKKCIWRLERFIRQSYDSIRGGYRIEEHENGTIRFYKMPSGEMAGEFSELNPPQDPQEGARGPTIDAELALARVLVDIIEQRKGRAVYGLSKERLETELDNLSRQLELETLEGEQLEDWELEEARQAYHFMQDEYLERFGVRYKPRKDG